MKISKKKLALFLFIAFFIGGIIGTSDNKTKTKTVEVAKNEIEWRDLKSIDDKIFSNLMSETTYIILKDDIKLEKLNEEYVFLNDERNFVLKKLGY